MLTGFPRFTPGELFNQSVEQVSLPTGMQSFTFRWTWRRLPRRLQRRELRLRGAPGGLQSFTFCERFKQSLMDVSLPIGLLNLGVGNCYEESLNHVSLPSGLRSVAFGQSDHGQCFCVGWYTEPLFWAPLQQLAFGWHFNQSLVHTCLPIGLQSFALGGSTTHAWTT